MRKYKRFVPFRFVSRDYVTLYFIMRHHNDPPNMRCLISTVTVRINNRSTLPIRSVAVSDGRIYAPRFGRKVAPVTAIYDAVQKQRKTATIAAEARCLQRQIVVNALEGVLLLRVLLRTNSIALINNKSRPTCQLAKAVTVILARV